LRANVTRRDDGTSFIAVGAEVCACKDGGDVDNGDVDVGDDDNVDDADNGDGDVGKA